MTKKISLKLISVIAALAVLLSVMVPLTALYASAQAPNVPANAVVVFDVEGKEITVGDYYNYLWDRLHKAAPVKDFSAVDTIEFDMNFSDYNAVKSAVASTGYPLCFNLTSSGGQWANRACSPNIFDFETGETDGWHHFRIPKTAFGPADATVINWSKVNYWMVGFNHSQWISTGSLTNVNISVKNICGTNTSSTAIPDLPETSVAVLDRNGISNKLGDNGQWRTNWFEGRFAKYGLTKVDFSSAENVEFDIKYSNYENFKNYVETNNVNFGLHLTSAGQAWADRSAANIMNYGVAMDDGWYHYSIPKSAFTVRQNGGVNWAKVDSWFLFGEGADVPFGEIYSDELTIVNICGTEAAGPELPSNAIAVLDKAGKSNTVGDCYNYLWDRLNKSVSAADFSGADFVELDIEFSDYDAVRAAVESTGFPLCFNLTSSGQAWSTRSFSPNIFDYETGVENGWHHFSIPKSAFTAADAGVLDWSKVNFWMFGFNYSNTSSTGSLSGVKINVKNICGTAYRPAMPENVVAVIDKDGCVSTVGDQYVQLCDRVVKNIADTDISAADYIEFDMQYQDFIGLNRAAGDLGLYITFNMASNTNKWYNRERSNDINSYATKGVNGWYHFKIPLEDFRNVNMGAIDLTAIKTWFVGFEGLNLFTDAGEYKNHSFNVKNVCATKATDSDIFRPALTGEALYVVDQLGILSNLAENAEDTYGKISEIFTNNSIVSGDFTASKKIYMNVYVDDVNALPSDLSISFGVAEGDSYRYLNKIGIKNQMAKNGWNEVVIPVKSIVPANADDLKNIAVWKLSTEDTSKVGVNKDCRLWVCNMAGTVDATAADMPENASVIIDEAGKESIIGTQFVEIFDRLYKRIEAVDISQVEYIEFDAKFDDFMQFAKKVNELDLRMSFHFTSSNSQWVDRFVANDILRYAMEGKNDWWHFKIPKSAFTGANVGDIDWKAVNLWMVGLDGTNMRENAGELSNFVIKIMNICGTPKDNNELLRPEVSGDAVALIDQMGVLGTFGKTEDATYDKLSDTFVSDTIVQNDLTLGKYVSLQVYADDTKALPETLKLAFGIKEGDSYRYLEGIEIVDQIVNNGWNEVTIPVSAIQAENEDDLKNIVVWKLVSEDTSKVGKYADSRLWVCNIIGIVDSTAPELPANILETLNYRGISNTPGSAFSWLADRMYQQAIGPFDIEAADYIEFDFYVEDYAAVKAAMEEKEMDLIFGISSGDPEKYTTSRYFNRSIGYFYDQVTKDGWNHIKLPVGQLISSGEGGPLDLSKVTSFMLSFMGDDIQGDSSAIADVTFKIINVCATTERPYIKIEKDEDKPSRPEKDVVYINDAEALFDDNGTWNPIAVAVDEDYKTEGMASISNVLFDQILRSNQLRYIFNETADLSDIETFKFDFFVSDIELLKQRAEMSLVISSDSRGLKDYYSWKLNLNSLKNGWNSVEIDIASNYTKSGSLDLAEVKAIIIQCDKADFKSDKYTEKVTVKVDNLRYVSKTGNTTLKINTEEELFDEDFDFDDIWSDGEEEFTEEEVIPGETIETPTTAAPVETDTRIVKKTVNNVVMQYTWLIIALAVEAVVVAGTVATVYLVKRKKNKSK